jgi:hypothetical protein
MVAKRSKQAVWIISADERLPEERGAKILIVGLGL